MKIRHLIPATLVFFALCLAFSGNARAGDKDTSPSATANRSHAAQDDPLRLEGEKRFHSNCGRCHAAPPKFGPRMMATIIRHMRVRSTITDEDMRLILHYMTE
jgi:cytochrome c5